MSDHVESLTGLGLHEAVHLAQDGETWRIASFSPEVLDNYYGGSPLLQQHHYGTTTSRYILYGSNCIHFKLYVCVCLSVCVSARTLYETL